MDAFEGDVCFICDKNVSGIGHFLSMEETVITKTALPKKLSQLIGDEFMVVVSKEDKICRRCVTLINRCDKLEWDLLRTKKLLAAFISLKYSLNTEDQLKISAEEFELSKGEWDAEEPCFVENSSLLLPSDIGEGSTSYKELDVANNQNYAYNDGILKTKVTVQDGSLIQSLNDLRKNGVMSQHVLSLKGVKIENEISDNSCCKNLSSSPANYIEESTLDRSETNDSASVEFTCTSGENVNNNANIEENVVEDLDPLSSCKKLPSTKSSLKKSVKLVSAVDSLGKLVKKTVGKNYTSTLVKKQRPILPKTSYIAVIPAINLIEPSYNTPDERCKSGIDLTDEELLELKYRQDEKISDNYSYNNWNQNNPVKIPLKDVSSCVSKTKYNNILFCTICQLEFESEELLEKHKNKHSKNGLFSCAFCPKMFKKKSSVRNHTAVKHTGKFKFCCDFCGKGFVSHTNFEEHRTSHTKEHLYICDICGKKFSFHASYWIHKKWHSDSHPYRCNECGKVFRHSSVLAVHRRKHTGERPYKCSMCTLTFAASNSYKRHLILHTKDYPFRCESCSQGFTTRFKYTEHMAKTHSVLVDKHSNERKVFSTSVENSDSVNPDLTEESSIEPAVDGSEVSLLDSEIKIPSLSCLNERIVEIVLAPSSMISFENNWLT